MADKSPQSCHCGWSKVTTYQGLRIHQGKMGCTPQGVGIPEPQQIIFNTYMPKFTYTLPPFDLAMPSVWPGLNNEMVSRKQGNDLTTEEFDRFDMDDSALQIESGAARRAPGTQGALFSPQTRMFSLSLSNQATPEAAPVQRFDSETDSKQGRARGQSLEPINSCTEPKILSKQPNPATTGAMIKMENKPLFGTAQAPLQSSDNGNKTRSALDAIIGSQQFVPMPAPQTCSSQMTAVSVKEKENMPSFQVQQQFVPSGAPQAYSTRSDSGAAVKEETVPLFAPPQRHADETQSGCDWFSGAPQTFPKPESFNAQPTAANTDVTAKEEKQLFFGPPQVQFTFSGSGNDTLGGYDWLSGAQQSISKPGSLNAQPTAANTEVQVQEENQRFFGPPQAKFNFSGNQAQGGFDRSSGAQQSVLKPWSFNLPPSAANTQMTVKEEMFQLHQSNPTSLLEQLVISDVAPQTTSSLPNPAATKASSNQENKPMFERSQQPFQSSNGNKTQRASHLSADTQQFASVPVSLSPNTKPTSTASDVTVKGFESAQQQAPITQPGPTTSGAAAKKATKPRSKTSLPAATSTGAQQPVPMPVSQSSSVTPEAAVKQENRTFLETPQHSRQSATDGHKTRRVLDFSTGAQQAQMFLSIPTTTPQETIVQPKEDNQETEMSREAEKLLQLHRDKIRAEIQTRIRSREQKLAEVRSCVKTCKGSLDAEWLEINSVFSDVIRVVEEARQKALQPLENRRELLKRDAHSLIKRLQGDIEKLERAMDEVDAADLDGAPLINLRSRDSCINTAFSFGTLQTTISTLTEQIQEELDELSAVELKRIPAFAVDVKMDPTTAHQWLIVSKDGKKVQDGGQSQQLPIALGRFDMFGSILGVNMLTSGKSYWEVEVGNKGGWDLGVAAGKANRKGKLTLSPDAGYWAIVHYEEDKYAALTAPPVCLELKEKPQKVGVFVDFDEGLVSFYDVTAQRHIHSFTKCLFNDVIFPYFSPHLKKNGKNSEPLVISPVKN